MDAEPVTGRRLLLADDPAALPDPVAGLIDIPLPREVSLWPQTWPARIAIAVLVTALLVSIWYVARNWRANRYRREALSELYRIENSDHFSNDETLVRITLLVRRTALAVFPRERIASLVGMPWLVFLDNSYGGRDFSQGSGRILVSDAYQKISPSNADLHSLIVLVRRWIKKHHA